MSLWSWITQPAAWSFRSISTRASCSGVSPPGTAPGYPGMPHLRGRERAWVALQRWMAPVTSRDGIVLAAARIADDLISRCAPSEEALFSLATQILDTRVPWESTEARRFAL